VIKRTLANEMMMMMTMMMIDVLCCASEPVSTDALSHTTAHSRRTGKVGYVDVYLCM